MTNYIVITTIHKPTKATMMFIDKKDWHVVIVGDKKTPHDDYYKLQRENENVAYLHPDFQESLFPALSSSIGWNTSARRNIGYVYAYKKGAEIIASVDDDNIPYENWGKNLHVGKATISKKYELADRELGRVFDPLCVIDGCEDFWHRGFPIEQVKDRKKNITSRECGMIPLIQVDLWDGDPDIDAFVRITQAPNVEIKIDMPFCSNCISPFDSQNTFFHRSIMKYFMLMPGTGRVDDIWGSYLLQQTFKHVGPYVLYCKPSVIQERNQHNLINDLQQEMFGYAYISRMLQGQTFQDFDDKYKLYMSHFD